ncbi:hypothetical protein [Albidovulum sp.]|uniref:hypothetical protein n=1 Tax=Albidovulum sp. TaxID=1872424 RepID=UPI00352903E4
MFHRFALRALLAASLLVVPGLARAAGPADEIAAALDLPEVFEIMGAEGAAYGTELETQMFPGAGGRNWAAEVSRIYATDRILPIFYKSFEAELQASHADTGAILDFFRSDLGRQVIELEVSARRALLDPSVEEASRLRLDELRVERPPRLAQVERFIAANDLIEANVASALNANYAFYQGLAGAGGPFRDMTDDDILREVWSQEDQVREETDSWMTAYLALAYAPIGNDDLDRYIAFSETAPARDLNRALFAAYDAVFVDVMDRLGQAAAAILAGQDL